MNKDKAIMLAKDNKVDSIYQICLLEGKNTSYKDIEMYVKGLVNAEFAEERNYLFDMSNSYDLLLKSDILHYGFDVLREIHKTAYFCPFDEAHELRTEEVVIEGSIWGPPIPEADTVEKDLSALISCSDGESRATAVFCYLIGVKLFDEGNERMAYLIANKILVDSGIGIFNVPVDKLDTLRRRIDEWYRTTDSADLFFFVKNNCIRRI